MAATRTRCHKAEPHVVVENHVRTRRDAAKAPTRPRPCPRTTNESKVIRSFFRSSRRSPRSSSLRCGQLVSELSGELPAHCSPAFVGPASRAASTAIGKYPTNRGTARHADPGMDRHPSPVTLGTCTICQVPQFCVKNAVSLSWIWIRCGPLPFQLSIMSPVSRLRSRAQLHIAPPVV